MATTKKQKIEENLENLDQIIEKFEEGGIGIEEGIKEYKKASGLIKKIKDELELLDKKVDEIREEYL